MLLAPQDFGGASGAASAEGVEWRLRSGGNRARSGRVVRGRTIWSVSCDLLTRCKPPVYGSQMGSEIDARHNVATDIGETFADPSSQPWSMPFTGSRVPLASTGVADRSTALREGGNRAIGNRGIPLPHHARV